MSRRLGVVLALLLLFIPGKVWAQTPISCGETKTGNLATPDQTDTYTFSGNTGEAVVITAVGTSGGVSAVATLQDSIGAGLASNGGGNSALASVLPTTGTYTIVVSVSGLNNTGTYEVSLQFSTGKCSTSISCGQTLAGNLSGVSQLDTYSFSGNAGEAVTVTTAGTAVSALAYLYDSSGSYQTDNSPGNTRFDFVLPTTDTYTIVVHDNSFNNTGAYQINLQFVTGRCSGSISCGQTLTGNLGSVVQRDAYSFSGNAGEAVIATSVGTSGGVSAIARLYSPSGVFLAANGGGNSALASVLPTTGTYTIVVSDSGLNNTGTYEVSLQFSTGKCSKSISCGQTLAGNLSGVSQLDTYSFSGNAGEAVTVTTAGTAVSALAYLYDSSGSYQTDNSPGNTRFDFVLPTTDTYTIVVHDK